MFASYVLKNPSFVVDPSWRQRRLLAAGPHPLPVLEQSPFVGSSFGSPAVSSRCHHRPAGVTFFCSFRRMLRSPPPFPRRGTHLTAFAFWEINSLARKLRTSNTTVFLSPSAASIPSCYNLTRQKQQSLSTMSAQPERSPFTKEGNAPWQ